MNEKTDSENGEGLEGVTTPVVKAGSPCNICGKLWPHHYPACAYVQHLRAAMDLRDALEPFVKGAAPYFDGDTVIVDSTAVVLTVTGKQMLAARDALKHLLPASTAEPVGDTQVGTS